MEKSDLPEMVPAEGEYVEEVLWLYLVCSRSADTNLCSSVETQFTAGNDMSSMGEVTFGLQLNSDYSRPTVLFRNISY